MRLHVLVDDVETARRAVEDGATVVQLRVKGASTEELLERGRPFRELPSLFVVNDDIEAALQLHADGVHLGREDSGAERARAEGLLLGLSAASVEEAVAAEQDGAAYIGAGPVWETPSKPDADLPIGLEGLAAICRAVSVPVVAIGGVDASNAADCIRAGATGVAVIRAAADVRRLVEAIDAAR
ncbi:MAG: thiamine phosphate synthase [Actinobacteria bacterium]|nr:MAG: thiamine phosphate synthase [Actinomycetota bacterium]